MINSYKYIYEITAENFINILKDIHLQILEAQGSKQDKLKENHV